jgi:Ran GTPase-activating protein (RanGAP) involved in mRNA processing and transport
LLRGTKDSLPWAAPLTDLVREGFEQRRCDDRAPTANPDLPNAGARVVARPELLHQLKQAVLAPLARSVAITSRVHKVWGMGGVGKTTLAKIFLHEEDVRARFSDGMAWVVLGNDGPCLTARQEDVHEQLLWRRPDSPFKDATQGTQVLRRALAGRACLLVVDDVWEKGHARAFDCLGPEGVLLITSRFDGVVSAPPQACVKVDVLTPKDGEAAMAVLRSYAREDVDGDSGGASGSTPCAPHEDGGQEEAMRALLRRCGGLPLAIAIAASLKRSRGATWGEVLESMKRHGGRVLTPVDSSEDYPYEGLREALGASVAHLKATRPREYECLLWYGLFMEDTWVPLEIVRRMEAVAMDAFKAKGVLKSLAGRSLLEVDEKRGWRSQAHDLLRDFLQDEARKARGEKGLQHMHLTIFRQGMNTCEKARFNPAGTSFTPNFGEKGVSHHLHGIKKKKVGSALPEGENRRQLDAYLGLGWQTITWNEFLLGVLRQPRACQVLQTLDLQGRMIGDEGACALAELLLQPGALPSLNILRLGKNSIGADGAHALAKVLRQPGACRALRTLDLARNRIDNEGARALAEALRQRAACALQGINLGNNQIGEEGARALAEALQQRRACALHRVHLGDNQIGDDGARAIAEALRQRQGCALKEIDLRGNQIGDKAARALAEALQQPGVCRDLRILNLGKNRIANEGACALAEALRGSGGPRLRSLNLGTNQIGDKGARALAEALRQPGACPKLQEVNIAANRIQAKQLRTLDLSGRVRRRRPQLGRLSVHERRPPDGLSSSSITTSCHDSSEVGEDDMDFSDSEDERLCSEDQRRLLEQSGLLDLRRHETNVSS